MRVRVRGAIIQLFLSYYYDDQIRRIRWVGYVVRIAEKKHACNIFIRKTRREDNIWKTWGKFDDEIRLPV
jgi:hypothetical protein